MVALALTPPASLVRITVSSFSESDLVTEAYFLVYRRLLWVFFNSLTFDNINWLMRGSCCLYWLHDCSLNFLYHFHPTGLAPPMYVHFPYQVEQCLSPIYMYDVVDKEPLHIAYWTMNEWCTSLICICMTKDSFVIMWWSWYWISCISASSSITV